MISHELDEWNQNDLTEEPERDFLHGRLQKSSQFKYWQLAVKTMYWNRIERLHQVMLSDYTHKERAITCSHPKLHSVEAIDEFYKPHRFLPFMAKASVLFTVVKVPPSNQLNMNPISQLRLNQDITTPIMFNEYYRYFNRMNIPNKVPNTYNQLENILAAETQQIEQLSPHELANKNLVETRRQTEQILTSHLRELKVQDSKKVAEIVRFEFLQHFKAAILKQLATGAMPSVVDFLRCQIEYLLLSPSHEFVLPIRYTFILNILHILYMYSVHVKLTLYM